jgi:hypothetical protein
LLIDLDVNTNHRIRHHDQQQQQQASKQSDSSVYNSKTSNSSISQTKREENSLGSSHTERKNLHPLSVESLTSINKVSSSVSEILQDDSEKFGINLSAANISYLIDTVKENVLQIEKNLKSDIRKLERDLSVEKSRRVRSDVKINNLIRLQSKKFFQTHVV